MGGGTEAFPDLGKHCEFTDCKQLDFLPFDCHACHKVYCLDHRSYKSHKCPDSYRESRRVILCETCSAAVEITGEADHRRLFETHRSSSECDPMKKKKKKPTCPVRRCREALTFSNSTVCKACGVKVCLGHRFPADHHCTPARSAEKTARAWNEKFLAAFSGSNGKDCGNSSVSAKSNNHSVKAC